MPRASFGPIGCGELVIADEETIPKLLSECPKMLAVAMEGAGVAQAAENAHVNFLEIRGISDLANPEKDDRWHIYAANAAAAFTRGFLRSKPIYPLSEEKRYHSSGDAVLAPPLVILRLQSQRTIRTDELLESLTPKLREREYETVGLDFTDLVDAGGKLTAPESAVTRLVDPKGELMTALSQRGGADFIFHGHAHIPLLVLAGFLTTDRQNVRLYDFHPTTNSWQWPSTGEIFPELHVRGLPERTLRRAGEVILRMPISYQVSTAQTRNVVKNSICDIEIGLQEPQRSIVLSEEQVREYGKIFRQILDKIVQYVPKTEIIHLFYAGPVSLAFHLGQQISENIHPPVIVWNYSRTYEWGINLAHAVMGEPSVIVPSNSTM